jgi:ABC-type multidrug transport system ATPase subunit
MTNAGEAILSLRNVTKCYGRVTALDNVSFDLPSGCIVALLGPNGAGKTTTFKCTLGVTGFQGDIHVAGKSVKRSGKAVRQSIGYLPQTPAFLGDDTCYDVLRFLAQLRRVPLSRVDEHLERVNLAEQRNMITDQLSGGMRQRLALAAALLSDPPLLLLDEPTANLDTESRRQFHDLLGQLREEGKTIILSTHFVEHMADLADRVVILQAGTVVLDRQVSELWAAPGRHFTVYLNGTAPQEFLDALRSVGISEDKVSHTGPSLEAVISRALGEAAGKDENAG